MTAHRHTITPKQQAELIPDPSPSDSVANPKQQRQGFHKTDRRNSKVEAELAHSSSAEKPSQDKTAANAAQPRRANENVFSAKW